MILKHFSVDCVVFGFYENKLNVLLWQSNEAEVEQFLSQSDSSEVSKMLYEGNPINRREDYWGLIGTHLPAEEDLDDYAKLILEKSTGIDDVYLKQVKTFGAVNRVPHFRVLTIAYYALINPEYQDMRQSEMVKMLKWFDVNNLPKVTFDHAEIIHAALKKLRQEVQYQPVGFHLLPEKFTLTELQSLYEVILDKELDTRNFRKKIQNMGLLIDTNEKQSNVAHRAAKLYQFDVEIYNQLKEDGLNFRIGY